MVTDEASWRPGDGGKRTFSFILPRLPFSGSAAEGKQRDPMTTSKTTSKNVISTAWQACLIDIYVKSLGYLEAASGRPLICVQ
jgi:hypothetical protein